MSPLLKGGGITFPEYATPQALGWRNQKKAEFLQYFRDIFTSKGPCRFPDDLFFLNQLTPEWGTDLCRIPSAEEIHSVIKYMHPTKALGLDGLPALFYQSGWGTIKDEVTSSI